MQADTRPRWARQRLLRYILKHVLKSDYFGQNCSIARSLEVVGERWTLLIVRELLLRPCRFAELERRLGIAKNILATRLEKLAHFGIVEKIPYTKARDWNEFRLTEKGRGLFFAVNALMTWGDSYLSPNGAPAVVEHSCGHPTGHRVVCEACGEEVTPDNVHITAGPGYRPKSVRD